METINKNDYKLCYVNGNKAYFTTDDLSEAWWNEWIRYPKKNRAGLKHYVESDNVIALYFEVQDDCIFYGDPRKATFSSQSDTAWFSYWATGDIEEHEATILVEMISGIPMDIFIETIINDGGLIYEMKTN